MNTVNRKCCCALLLLLSVILIQPVMAEDGPGVKIKRIETSTYTGVANFQASQSSAVGVKRSAKAPTGMMFVILDMDLAGTWDEETKRHQVNQRNTTLTDESGANYTPIGRIYHGSYSPSPSGVFMSRANHLFKDNPNYETFFNYMPVYLVPEKTRKVTFKLDKFDSRELEVTEAKAEMGLINMPKIQVLGAKKVPEVKAKLGSFSGGLEVVGKASTGQMIEVNIQFQPTAPNNGTSFSVFSRWLGITCDVDGKTMYIPSAGGTSYRNYSPDTSTSMSMKDGQFTSKSVQWNFIIPDGATNLQLHYLMEKIGPVEIK